jgi:hypothetical protein
LINLTSLPEALLTRPIDRTFIYDFEIKKENAWTRISTYSDTQKSKMPLDEPIGLPG